MVIRRGDTETGRPVIRTAVAVRVGAVAELVAVAEAAQEWDAALVDAAVAAAHLAGAAAVVAVREVFELRLRQSSDCQHQEHHRSRPIRTHLCHRLSPVNQFNYSNNID